MKKIFVLSLLLAYFICYACVNDTPSMDDSVDQSDIKIYLIDNFDVNGDDFQIDESSVTIKDSPFLTYSDLISYNSDEYSFELSENGKEKIENLELPSGQGLPFAVVSQNKLIYTGYFWPSYLSRSCAWVVIDPTELILGSKISVKLGHPAVEGITDNRNNPALLEILRKDSKLK